MLAKIETIRQQGAAKPIYKLPESVDKMINSLFKKSNDQNLVNENKKINVKITQMLSIIKHHENLLNKCINVLINAVDEPNAALHNKYVIKIYFSIIQNKIYLFINHLIHQ